MDSCHLFNFLFGTKRAASELSKCFTSAGDDRKRKLHREGETACASRTPPPSPLKQLQMKISSLAANTRRKVPTKSESHSGRDCDARCGTYRASLVKLLDEPSEISLKEEQQEEITNVTTQVSSLDNPSDMITSCAIQRVEDGKSAADADRQETKIRRLVLYDDEDIISHQNPPILASTAEVYNVVSSLGEARARLRRVSSISYTEETNVATEEAIKEEPSQHSLSVEDNQNELLSSGNEERSLFVRNLVQSIESKTSPLIESTSSNSRKTSYPGLTTLISGLTKPTTIVKPLPPETPPKSNRARFITNQLCLSRPTKISQLFTDETFLRRFFNKLAPLDRCTAAQVCRQWRRILYSDQDYWRDLVSVIDCTQLRREHLVECILSTLQTAKLKHQRHLGKPISGKDGTTAEVNIKNGYSSGLRYNLTAQDTLADLDTDDVWRIQELCNRFSSQHRSNGSKLQALDANNNISSIDQQTICSTSKSSSIPSQISSTFSSMSLSSLLSPLSESSRIDNLKDKLYTSIVERGFDAISLFGATDEDIDDLITRLTDKTLCQILTCRLHNCSITNKALELLIDRLCHIQDLELSGCNEITNSFDLLALKNLRCLTITDCINIADGIAQKLAPILGQLDELTVQAYHLTDTFLDYLSLNGETTKLIRLELPNCKEITNQSLATLALHFTKLETLSISGSTKITDEGVEVLAEKLRNLKCLDLSWCPRITDSSLECIACDLGDTLTDLVLDRNVHITDAGLGYLTMMSNLTLLYIRWCPRVTDLGIETIIQAQTLRYLSLAGLHQVTARSLLCLVETNLLELELTNCPAINGDLIMFLAARMPQCNIVF